MNIVCIGIGSNYRQDDALGLRVAERLRERELPNLRISSHNREGISLLNAWEGAQAVILVDAVVSGAEPGMLFRCDAHRLPLPESCFVASSHAIGLGQAIELARRLDQLPPVCLIFGIEGACYEPGTALSPAVEAAIPRLVDVIVACMEDLQDDS